MKFFYYLFRSLTFPVSLLPFSMIHFLGKILGNLLYYFFPKYRKRCLSNLALATALHLDNHRIKKIARASLQNTAINILEYAKLARVNKKKLQQLVKNQTPEVLQSLAKAGQGAIVFCGHQANWEVSFLLHSAEYPCAAIGRPIANNLIYNFVQTMRQKFGGKIILPEKALWEGMRVLKRGHFLGIVGDQGMPKGGYLSDFLGRKAWTSALPALLAYRTQSPIVVATTVRLRGFYTVHHSAPIYPDKNASMEIEIPRLMNCILNLFAASVQQHPEQWFWQHNRWKQKFNYPLKRIYRQDAVAIILPQDISCVEAALHKLLNYYAESFVTLFAPEKSFALTLPDHVEVKQYTCEKDILIPDHRFKIVFNLSEYTGVKKHFLKLSALHVIPQADVEALIK